MLRNMCFGVVLVASALFASTASAGIFKYQLLDHPDSARSPEFEYGLRMDSQDLFLSFSHLGSDVLLTYDDGGGVVGAASASISGTARQSLGDGAFSAEAWDVEYTLSDVVDLGGGFFMAGGGSGSISLGGVEHLLTGKAMGGVAFKFVNDGHRLGGHADYDRRTPVGRGWVMGSPSPNDFLFVATTPGNRDARVPEPASLAIFGALGVLGFVGVRRSKRRV